MAATSGLRELRCGCFAHLQDDSGWGRGRHRRQFWGMAELERE